VLVLPAIRGFAVGERPGATAVDVAVLQRPRDLGQERLHDGRLEIGGPLEGMQPLHEEDLGFVLVADAGDEGLVEQQIGEVLAATLAKPSADFGGGEAHGQRVGPEPLQRSVGFAGILRSELQQRPIELDCHVIPGREDQSHARVLAHVRDRRTDPTRARIVGAPPPAHARRRPCGPALEGVARIHAPLPPHHHVVVQPDAAAEGDHEMLAVGFDCAHPRTDETRHEPRIERRLPPELDALDALADEHLREAVGGAAHLGSFGHVAARCKARAGAGAGEGGVRVRACRVGAL
jgi:hypothetical protein